MGKGTLAGHGAPTTARVVGCRPEGGSTFFRCERKYQRKPAARRLQRRPTSLCAVGFGLREPNGWMPRINSGHPIPALRPEQSDHVPWADCPQGCPRPRLAALTRREKALYCPFLKEGVRNVARSIVGQLSLTIVRARTHSFPLSKRAGLFPFAAYRRSAPPQSAWGRLIPCRVGGSCGWLALQGQRPTSLRKDVGLCCEP